MPTLCEIAAGAALFKKRVAVRSLVEIDRIDRDAATRISHDLLQGSEQYQDKGPLRIDADYDQGRAQLSVTLVGSLPAMKLLDHADQQGKRLFEEQARVSMTVQIDPVQRPAAIAVTDHLLAAAKNHPPHDLPLRIDTDYDEAHARLEVMLAGSVFATSYLLMLIHVHLTQSRLMQ